MSYVKAWSLNLAISSAPIPKRPGWIKRRYIDESEDWIPYDVREPVETAGFWAMVDRENRRHAGRHREQNGIVQGDPRVGVEGDVEEVSDCNGTPDEGHDTSSTPEQLVEGEKSATVPGPSDVNGAVETTHARTTLSDVPTTVARMEPDLSPCCSSYSFYIHASVGIAC